MDVRLVTPLGALFAITALVPLAVFVLRRRRLREMRRALGLEEPSLVSQWSLLVALVAVPALLGVAAMQPVIETTRTVRQRTDVQAFVVLDVSRSMLASAEPGAATRLQRARRLALDLRTSFPQVPFGIASLTDRVLPHLFPTTDARVFEATLERAIEIDNPPPRSTYVTVATNLTALRSIPGQSYFLPSVKRRVLVVLTDGESATPESELATAFEHPLRVETALVRVAGVNEGIYETGVAEGGYTPDPRSASLVARAAGLMGGRAFEEADAGPLAEAVREAVGTGDTVTLSESSGRFALMPFIALAALIPLVFLLARRNVWWRWRFPERRAREAAPGAAKVPAPRGVAQPG